MNYICVICTLNRPPLLPLAIEHRTILEAIVSPVINMDDLKSCHLLLCMDCQVKMLLVHQFQKTALQGIRNLKYLLSRFNAPPPLQPVVPKKTGDAKPETIIIKIEHSSDEESDVAEMEDKNVKMESQHQPELAVQSDSGLAAVSCESDGRESSLERPTTSSPVTQTTPAAVSKRPLTRQAAAAGAAAAPRGRSARKRCKIKKPAPLPCPHSPRTPSHAATLRAHKKHMCGECGMQYARSAGLQQHVRVAHERRRTRPSFVCELCEKAYKVKKALKEHLLTHQGLRPYRCQSCPATFSYSAALYSHLNIKHLHKKRGKKKAAETNQAEG